MAHAALVAVTVYEPSLGAPTGGYPIVASHTDSEKRATAESTFAIPSTRSWATKTCRLTCVFLEDWPGG